LGSDCSSQERGKSVGICCWMFGVEADTLAVVVTDILHGLFAIPTVPHKIWECQEANVESLRGWGWQQER